MKNVSLSIVSIVCIFVLMASVCYADQVLFNGFESPPYSSLTIVINGTQAGATTWVDIDTTMANSGSNSLMWVNQATNGFGSDFFTWNIDYGSGQNFTGGTTLSAWQYWDYNTTGSTFWWTIQFGLRDTTVGNHDLGNWNEGPPGYPPYHTWYKRTWPCTNAGSTSYQSGTLTSAGVDLSAVDRLYCYSHPNDYGGLTTASGTITIWIDDVTIEGPVVPVELSNFEASNGTHNISNLDNKATKVYRRIE